MLNLKFKDVSAIAFSSIDFIESIFSHLKKDAEAPF
jgi:hypothetical protein